MTSFNQLLDQVNVAIANMKYPAQPTGLYEPIQYVLALADEYLTKDLSRHFYML